jgi:hypothetical protein
MFKNEKGQHNWPQLTICEAVRQTYDQIVLNCQDKPQMLITVIPLIEKIYEMGITMTKKLTEYKMSLPDWEKNESKEEVARIRQLRIELEKTLNNIRPKVS